MGGGERPLPSFLHAFFQNRVVIICIIITDLISPPIHTAETFNKHSKLDIYLQDFTSTEQLDLRTKITLCAPGCAQSLWHFGECIFVVLKLKM